MTDDLPTTYDPRAVEGPVSERWAAEGAFAADPAADGASYTVVIPPPNVTAPLHLGHALNNTLQDVLIRYHRMAGDNTLWMPGTDHAGIATQTVVEKRILADENKRRTDFTRDEFIARVQAWKDEYEARILIQLKLMGCSCDWDRTRFTMDDVCARAVREVFFKLFADGLIYRGKRLVNWDPATQTVLADDEVEHQDVAGHFWYLRYPLTEAVTVGRSMGVSPMHPEGDQPVTRRQGSYLPHWTQPGAKYAVTFRLGDSVPQDVAEAWRQARDDLHRRAERQGRELTPDEQRELARLHSDKIEAYLDAGHGQCYMADARIARLVRDALKHFNHRRYDLVAWCVMPNHVHAVVRPLGDHTLPEILHSWKSFTAREANNVLGLSGQFWKKESYDHLIRDEDDFNNQVNYILANPAKAGLSDWGWCGYESLQEQDAPATHGQDAHATITHVTVATTRPETMLGDTAVAMNPRDPLAEALVGKMVRLPLVGRVIPIIADDHVVLPDPDSDDEKARFSTGFLKVTPAHDPDDWQIGQRHDLPVINVMAPDGSISDRHGWDDCAGSDAEFLLGMDRFEAGKAIVEWFKTEGLLADVREYVHPVGHSYRSHVPIEPYLSDQWYIAVKQPIAHLAEPFGEGVIEGTDVPLNSLAGLALKPLLDGRLRFVPDRYANTYRAWLENLRDWPISRQLWWGHRIPVWSQDLELPADVEPVESDRGPDAQTCAALDRAIGGHFGDTLRQFPNFHYFLRREKHPEKEGWIRTYICARENDANAIALLENAGWTRDEDVLDTWFSSALWPFSTMGWPDETPELARYYPGNLLCTAREIITLWVSRMVMMGQYCLGAPPFPEVFIHAMIQDGEGRKMSKSLGNGIDPLDIIDSHGADAMRFTLVTMTTQTQDVRMPVAELVTPDGRTVNSSTKFDIGRNFCNKLWNAARFALMNLQDCPPFDPAAVTDLADRWILSRLATVVGETTTSLENYRYNELADGLYHFMWDDFCDWYLEIAKSRINAGETTPKAVLALCLDHLLRLLHPICPFITEAIWAKLNETVPSRLGDQPDEPLLVRAAWPASRDDWIDPDAIRQFPLLQDLVRQVRNVRKQHDVPPSRKVDALIEADGDEATLIGETIGLLQSQAGLGEVSMGKESGADEAAATVSAGGIKLHVLGVIDRDAELARLTRQCEQLTKGIDGIGRKLTNEKFVSNAPADVVQRERDRMEQLQAQLAVVQEAIASLSG
ncbi:MAG TPA: valine--tRNA ligase [Phycisphaerae bacterium]|nr:valine--tRNA ligase [Phycisphaerae bacterium]HDZ43619.1 valine--tRNA ligase [Phycisphaerae bacterium]